MLIESHTPRAVVRLCGFQSVAMLDYLERTGVFVPAKRRPKNRGRQRRYSFREVLVLKAISLLLRNGASVANLKTALEQFQRIPWRADEAVLEDKLGPLKRLIVSGQKIYLLRSDNELVDMASNGQLAFSFMIDLDKLHADLCRDWRQASLNLVA